MLYLVLVANLAAANVPLVMSDAACVCDEDA